MSRSNLTSVGIRSALVDALHADLIGPFLPPGFPGAGEEVLPLAPRSTPARRRRVGVSARCSTIYPGSVRSVQFEARGSDGE